MQIAFVTAEVSPIAKTGGLGDVAGALPKALANLGHDVWLFMPFYRQAREYFSREALPLHVIAPTFPLHWDHWTCPVTLYRTELPGTAVPLILVGCDPFFDRTSLYSPDPNGDDDNLERFTFFTRAVIRAVELLGLHPDIVHAHDWHTALLPVYLHSGLRGSEHFRDAASVFTIHNLNYQGVGTPAQFSRLGLHNRYWRGDALEHWGTLNFMKGGLLFSDQVTTVSPTYAKEIQTPMLGAGLDGVVRSRTNALTGILNGIDAEEWDPSHDVYLDSKFDAGHLSGKSFVKRALAVETGLTYRKQAPLIGVVSRLVEQKGLDLLVQILPRLIAGGAQVVILGSGEPYLEESLRTVAAAHPTECAVYTTFDVALAHRIIAGADLTVMPSLYEPCGLNQMYALRYGTIPVVRMTGGLADTVIAFDGTNPDMANGFGFYSREADDLYAATWIALLNYKDQPTWRQLQQNGMTADFDWEQSARRYVEVYERARNR
jgi:starch synthase